jgi:hypothetical protein
MQTFWEWLGQLRLAETYVTFDPKQYDQLFDEELEKVIARTSDAKHRQALEKMRGFGWMCSGRLAKILPKSTVSSYHTVWVATGRLAASGLLM